MVFQQIVITALARSCTTQGKTIPDLTCRREGLIPPLSSCILFLVPSPCYAREAPVLQTDAPTLSWKASPTITPVVKALPHRFLVS